MSEPQKPHPCWIAEEGIFDHEWKFQSDEIGDPGVINGTYTECYLECEVCGETKEADYADYPHFDDDYF